MGVEPDKPSWIEANWGAPARIRAGTTTRVGGCSLPPFDSLNLARHVGDDDHAVDQNRERIRSLLSLPSEPVWLEQVHGNRILPAGSAAGMQADAVWTDRPGVVCAVMTADCVPVLVANATGTRVAAIHVGWRGLCAGIIERALEVFSNDTGPLHVWIGPHIRQIHFEVGDEVRDACLAVDAGLESAFSRNARGRWQADLERMIRTVINTRVINHVSALQYCTYAERNLFYSYRRDGRTGRTASLIWINPAG